MDRELELTLVVVEPEAAPDELREDAFWNWNTDGSAIESGWTPPKGDPS